MPGSLSNSCVSEEKTSFPARTFTFAAVFGISLNLLIGCSKDNPVMELERKSAGIIRDFEMSIVSQLKQLLSEMPPALHQDRGSLLPVCAHPPMACICNCGGNR